jgi:glutamate formiminotransferase
LEELELAKKQYVHAVPNFSNGRDKEVYEAVVDQIRNAKGVKLIGYFPDADFNRTVIECLGEPGPLKEALLNMAAKSYELIDMEKQEGKHPRIGAQDTIPIFPLHNITLEECTALAEEIGKEVWERFQVPVYFSGENARTPERRELAYIRKGQYEGLKEVAHTPERCPDLGPAKLHPTAGATIVSAAPRNLVAVTLEMITESGESGERELQVFFSTLRSKFLAFFPKSIYTLLTKSVVFLLSPPDPDSGAKTFQNNIVKVAEHLNEEAMRELRCQILVSVGGYKPDPLNTHESYREAIGAQRVAKLSSHAQNVVFWEFLGAMKLLSMISQNHEAALFCHNMLDKVIEHDSGCNGELLETLRVLSKCNWNIKHASVGLNIPE